MENNLKYKDLKPILKVRVLCDNIYRIALKNSFCMEWSLKDQKQQIILFS